MYIFIRLVKEINKQSIDNHTLKLLQIRISCIVRVYDSHTLEIKQKLQC